MPATAVHTVIKRHAQLEFEAANSNVSQTPPVYMNHPGTYCIIEYYINLWRTALGLASIFNRHLEQIGKTWRI